MEILVEVGFAAELARDVFVRTPVRLQREPAAGSIARRAISQVDYVRAKQMLSTTQRQAGLQR
jgi:hypothetical protein